MFALSYDNNEWHVFWMVDVANNAGLLSLSLDYVLYTNPEHVARFFYDILFNYEGAVNDIRGRA